MDKLTKKDRALRLLEKVKKYEYMAEAQKYNDIHTKKDEQLKQISKLNNSIMEMDIYQVQRMANFEIEHTRHYSYLFNAKVIAEGKSHEYHQQALELLEASSKKYVVYKKISDRAYQSRILLKTNRERMQP